MTEPDAKAILRENLAGLPMATYVPALLAAVKQTQNVADEILRRPPPVA